jgi:AcrR family transcriptional regulator
MARTVNTAVHALRREAFVDVAERLIQSKGYEQMTVQDVLNELDASRGAFYHYFDSKVALLEAVVEHMVDAATAALAPVMADPDLSALAKLERLFTGLAGWKSERKELVLALIQVWLSDDNAIVREKLRRQTVVRIAPLLAAVVRQGRDEGLFTASSPDDAARVLVSLLQGANEVATELFVARQANAVSLEVVERTFTAYSEAFERILGIPDGSLKMVNRATVREWFGQPVRRAQGASR